MSETGWLTVKEASRQLKVHEQTVRGWLRSGQIEGRKIGRRAGWRVRASEIERFLSEGPTSRTDTRAA